MTIDLTSVRLAILAAEGPESAEATREPAELFHSAGANVAAVSTLETMDEARFDALLLPTGKTSAERLAANPDALSFVRSFIDSGRPVGAIADGAKVLVATNAISGRRLSVTSALKEPLRKVRAEQVNKDVVVDRNLVTAAEIDAIESFCETFAQICSQHKSSSGGSLHTD